MTEELMNNMNKGKVTEIPAVNVRKVNRDYVYYFIY